MVLDFFRHSWAVANRVPHWFFCLVLIGCWYVQYVFIFTNYPPSFYFASSDFMSIAFHLQDPANWGEVLRDNNTGQFRGVGYPLYLLVASFGTLDISLIENANYAIILASYLCSYLLLTRFLPRSVAFVVVAVVALSYAPFAFAVTIISEHLIVAMLMIIAPLGVLSVITSSLRYRISLVLMVFALCMVKSMFLPMFILFVAFWIIEWGLCGWRSKLKDFGPLVGGAMLLMAGVSPINTAFVSNYSSGMFIFGLMNTLNYGSDTQSDNLHEIYEPLFEQGLLDEAKVRSLWNLVLASAEKQKSVIPVEYRTSEIAEIRKLLFNVPSLETYWQLKWIILRGYGEEEDANNLARGMYFDFVQRHPLSFIRNTALNWYNFSIGQPRHFTYAFQKKDLFRDEGGLKIYRTHVPASQRFVEKWRSNGIVYDEVDARRNRLVSSTAFNDRIKLILQAIYSANALIMLIWVVISLFNVVKNRGFCRSHSETWWRWTAASFILQGSFFGLGLGTVLLHPPLGRYFLPFLPLVVIAAIASVRSIAEVFRNSDGPLGHYPRKCVA